MTAASPAEHELARRVVGTMMAKDAFSAWLGVEIVNVEPRTVTIRMTVRDDMLNGFGVCHGGVTFAFADSALAFVSNTHGRVTMSIENGITYPTSVALGDVLTAVAEEETANKRLAFCRVTVRRGDEIVALFHGTVYRTDRDLPLIDA
jgi:acyl-CoA thioesterase